MTSFIRPPLRAAAWRLREVLSGLALSAFGLWWAAQSYGLMSVFGWAVVALGGVVAFVGLQRARFRRAGRGPGVVEVTEAQISYFGPLEGGIIALDLLSEVGLDPSGYPLHWVLRQRGGVPLHIPVTARGAELLFDAFAQLPGLRTQAMLRKLENPGKTPSTIWKSPTVRLS